MDSDKFYEFDFRYLVNLDSCSVGDIEFQVILYDINLFSELLFEFNATDDQEVVNNQWNNYTTCFEVFGREYQLSVVMISKCTKPGNKAFIAVDEIKIRESSEDRTETICRNFKITNAPSTIIETVTIDDSTQPTPNDTCLF